MTRFLWTLFVIFHGTAWAGELDLGVGFSGNAFLYNEELKAPSKSSETSVYAAYLGQLRYTPADFNSFLQLKYEGTGSVRSQYNGSDLNTNQPLKTIDSLQFGNLEGLLNLSLQRRFRIYGGYGYRVWDRNLAGTPGYEEIYSWFYIPVGLQLLLHESENVKWSLDLSVRPTSQGLVDVITSKTYSGGQNTKLNLGSRAGYRIALPIEKQFRAFGWSLTLWFEHSAIGESVSAANSTLAPGAGESIYEPSSHTDQFGLEALLIFRL